MASGGGPGPHRAGDALGHRDVELRRSHGVEGRSFGEPMDMVRFVWYAAVF